MAEEEMALDDWLDLAMTRMSEEVECVRSHIANQQYSAILLHYKNLQHGIGICARAIIDADVISILELAQVNAQIMTDAHDVEFVAEQDEDGCVRIVQRPVVVPDDLSGLDANGGESDGA